MIISLQLINENKIKLHYNNFIKYKSFIFINKLFYYNNIIRCFYKYYFDLFIYNIFVFFIFLFIDLFKKLFLYKLQFTIMGSNRRPVNSKFNDLSIDLPCPLNFHPWMINGFFLHTENWNHFYLSYLQLINIKDKVFSASSRVSSASPPVFLAPISCKAGFSDQPNAWESAISQVFQVSQLGMVVYSQIKYISLKF